MNKTHFYPQVLGRVFLLSMSLLLVAFFAIFLLLPQKASAADAGEFVYFRIGSEINPLIANKGTLTLRFSCGGATAAALINDNSASESTQAANGIIILASASKEMTDASCDFGGTADTIRASISIDGWVTRTWETVLPASNTAVFTVGASMDYNIVVNGVDDELGTAITLDGTTASASYSGTVASQSYSGGKKYIAGSTSGGTVKGGADGYVNRTSSALTVSSTASQSVDFGVDTDSSLDESGLDFGHKVRVYESGGSFADNKFTTGVVTAGDSFTRTCTNNSDGNWYCPVPLADTETSAKFILTGYVTTTATYTDRSAGSSASDSIDITPVRTTPSGGGGTIPTPTPGVTPTPTTSVSPTPTPSGIPPEIAIPSVSMIPAVTYELYRKVNDPKVYVKGSDGTLRWVKTLADFNAAGYKWSDVKLISGSEFAKMRVGGQLKVVKGIKFLRVRESNSTKSKIMGQVLPGQQLEFYEIKNGWYRIKRVDSSAGWIFGGYTSEL